MRSAGSEPNLYSHRLYIQEKGGQVKPFRATYTPWDYKENKSVEQEARTVLVMALPPIADAERVPLAIFIDNDNTLKCDRIDRLTGCVADWQID